MNDRPLKTQAIKRFLVAKTHPDLANLYTPDLEVQVHVGQDGGTKVQGEYKGKSWSAWTDGFQTWKSFRIPLNANTDPQRNDGPLNYDLVEHAEGIGCTGWDFERKVSKWVGFDFDAISGHREVHSRKLTDVELLAVQDAACNIPWVTVRKSTSGNGRHLYVFVDDVPTATHTEHAALARAILGKMSAVAGFDFNAKVDVMGYILWLWHRKMAGTDGLTLIRQGEVLTDIPPNWKDHVSVVTGKRRKNRPSFVDEIQEKIGSEADRLFEELTGQATTVPLDAEHKALINYLEENNKSWQWDSDHHMLITHTLALEDAHRELNLKGPYRTLSKGSSDMNCFCFPLRRGSWAIRRYSPGVAEAETWSQDAAGWTRCYYNRDPDLQTVARAEQAVEHKTGGYIFAHAEQAQKAALSLGADLALPNWALMRRTKLKEHKDGRLLVELPHDPTDNGGEMKGWNQEGKTWTKIFDAKTTAPVGADLASYDDMVRHLVTSANENYGWVIKSDNLWRVEPLAHVGPALGSGGLNPKDRQLVIGTCISKPWTLVSLPFQPEYPGDRTWNRESAQFRFYPSENLDDLNYPHWSKILNHVGAGLDLAIQNNVWARTHGLQTGADYLKVWLASLFQRPTILLPYLFLYSMEQNTGKSIFHEAVSMLLTTGVVRADYALTSTGNFNAELEKAVLCVVEETDLRVNKQAYLKIKDWVTGLTLVIHRKNETPYTVKNTSHWIQCHHRDEWILTVEGPRQIKELLNRPVTIQYGGKSIQTDGFFETGQHELFEIQTVEGFKIRATAAHPLSVDFDGLILDQRVDQLAPGSKLVLCDHQNLSWGGEGSFEDGYLVGSLFGDGNICKDTRCNSYKNHLLFCKPDYCMIQWVSDLFPDYPQIQQYGVEFRITSPYLEELRVRYGIDARKIVNEHIESSSSEFQAGFLSAFFDNDGGVPATEIRLAQSNLPRLEAVQRMLIHFGIVGEIQPCTAEGEYYLVIRKSNILRFQKRIGFQHPFKAALVEQLVTWHRGTPRQREDFLVRVKTIKSIGIHDTYDVTVPGVHHFSANGFSSHNCANDPQACPVPMTDTRITMIQVSPIDPTELIPKTILMTQLEKEASDFMAALLSTEIPPSNDRLGLPIIISEDKISAAKCNQTELERFIDEKVHRVDGLTIKFSELYDAFRDQLDPSSVAEWSKIKVGREVPPNIPKGRSRLDGQMHLGNISWTARSPGDTILPKLVVQKEMLVSFNEATRIKS